MNQHEYYMNEAISEALKARDKKEVPVGAVIVRDDQIIARAHNTREQTQVSIHHAEIIAIEEACKHLGTWRLDECEMYVTLEPCIMCSGSLILSRLKKVYFGAKDPKSGSVVSLNNVLDHTGYNHKVNYEGGILANECSTILKEFFRSLRMNK